MRTRFLIPLVILVVVLVAGCRAGNTVVNTTPADQSGITVSGHGEVQAPPDTATVDVGVQVTAANVGDARDRAATSADAVVTSLKNNGVDAKDIKTIDLSIQPQYQYGTNSVPKLIGYTVTNTVEAKIRKLETVSKAVDDAVTAGGNDARLSGLTFTVENKDQLIQQARQAAMNDARTKADQLAKLGGVSLGKPITISENQSTPPIPFAAPADAKTAQGGVPSTPIQPGTSTLTVDLQVRWALQ